MRQKRYIELVAEEMITLEQGYKNNKNHQFRQRCHALLLSNQGHDMASLKTLLLLLMPLLVIGLELGKIQEL